MLIEEFETLTNFHPTDSHFEAIHAAYAASGLDKRAWCEAYAANRDGMAEAIARRHDLDHACAETRDRAAREALEAKVEHLRRELEQANAYAADLELKLEQARAAAQPPVVPRSPAYLVTIDNDDYPLTYRALSISEAYRCITTAAETGKLLGNIDLTDEEASDLMQGLALLRGRQLEDFGQHQGYRIEREDT